MTRQDVKNAVKTLLQSVTQLKEIDTFRPKIQNRFPAVVITLPKSDETRLSAQAPNGKKRLDFTCRLEIIMEDVSNDGSAQLQFDDLLDAIDVALRSDVQLGGLALASTIEYIRTAVNPPTLVLDSIALVAFKEFDITILVTG